MNDLIKAFEQHVAERVICPRCGGTGRMTFAFRSVGKAVEPKACPEPTCESGWVKRE